MEYCIYMALIFMVNFSCDLTEELDPGGTAVEKLAGDWFIKIYENEVVEENLLLGSYYTLSTYNTSANIPTELYLDDHETWPYKGVLKVNAAALTFDAAAGGANFYNDTIFAEILGGQVWLDAVQPPSGTTTDSIQIRFKFSNYDNEVIYSGYRRTGFPEDEH